MPRTVLVLDDDRDFLERLTKRSANRDDLTIKTCDSVDGLATVLESVHPDCILLDYILGHDVAVERVATDLRSSGFLCPIILVSQVDCSQLFRDKAAIQKLLSLGVRLFLRKGNLTYTADLWWDAVSFVIESERHLAQTAIFADMYFYSSRVLKAHADLRTSVDALARRFESPEAAALLEQLKLVDLAANLDQINLSAANLARVVEEVGVQTPERSRSELSDQEISEGLDLIVEPVLFEGWFESLGDKAPEPGTISEPTVDKFLRTLNSLDDEQVDQQRKFFLTAAFGMLSSRLTNIDKSLVYSSLKAL